MLGFSHECRQRSGLTDVTLPEVAENLTLDHVHCSTSLVGSGYVFSESLYCSSINLRIFSAFISSLHLLEPKFFFNPLRTHVSTPIP